LCDFSTIHICLLFVLIIIDQKFSANFSVESMLEGVTMNTMWMAHKTKSYSKKQRDSPQNGSPTHFMQDEYDFPEDKMSDDGDDRFLDDHDETDEGLFRIGLSLGF
jgi:hypothetical protein